MLLVNWSDKNNLQKLVAGFYKSKSNYSFTSKNL